MKILFQGDSITDCNRLKTTHGLGEGYVYFISKEFQEHEIINRGISGNRMSHLKKRWIEDTIKINPDLLTILIGINDVWHMHVFRTKFSIDKFEKNYRELLDLALKNNPELKIILMTPFNLPIGNYRSSWNKEFDLIMNVCHKLAMDYKLPLVNLHETIQIASYTTKPEKLLYDGVHPTPLGHEIIKNEWIQVYKHIKK
ncbi:MAG: SGNH/GDSL hydrolase family protein [Acholeplasmataceae bacterium]|nr:SGNH/GDSL hydrolase family protein [Acholeplasmataceae bacterium]